MAKQMNARVLQKNDLAENWEKASGFIPKLGEIIVYNADENNPIPRIKIGNGVDIVNDLPFVTTSADGEIDLEGIATEDWVKQYVDENSEAAAIVYLSTRDLIGKQLELPDVYPIQADNPKLEIISKNMLFLYSDSFQSGSLSLSPDNSGYINIMGSPSSDKKITLHNGFSTTLSAETHGIKLPAPGKYTVSIDSENHDVTSGIKLCCYFLSEGIQVLHRTFDIVDNRFECTIDSKELAFDTMIPYIFIPKNVSITYMPSYRVQIEPGDVATSYTPYKYTFNNKKIISYNRNVFDGDKLSPTYLPSIKSGYKVTFGSTEEVTVDTSGAYYIRGVVGDAELGEQFSVYDDTGTRVFNGTYYTPFNSGDKYTFSFVEINSEELTEMTNVQLLAGHVDESEYITPDKKIADIASDGSSDYSILQFPYSYLTIQNDSEDAYRIHVRFDPALTRDWTEKQLEDIDDRLDYLERLNIQGDMTPGPSTNLSGVGKETEEGGEIFNDYEDNKAIGDFTSASGNATRAGGRGYHISNLEYLVTSEQEEVAIEALKETWVNLGDNKSDSLVPNRFFFMPYQQVDNYSNDVTYQEYTNDIVYGLKSATFNTLGPGTHTQREITFDIPNYYNDILLLEGTTLENIEDIQDIEFYIGGSFDTAIVKFRLLTSGGGIKVYNETPIITAGRKYSLNQLVNTLGDFKEGLEHRFKEKITRLDIAICCDAPSMPNRVCSVTVGSAFIIKSKRDLPANSDNWTAQEWITAAEAVNTDVIPNWELIPQFEEDIENLKSANTLPRTMAILSDSEEPSDWGGSKSQYYTKQEDNSFVKVSFTKTNGIIEPAYEANKYYNFKITNHSQNEYRLKLILNDTEFEEPAKASSHYTVGDIVNLDIDWHHYQLFYISKVYSDPNSGCSIIEVSPRASYNFTDPMTGATKEVKVFVPTQSQLKLKTNVDEDYNNWIWVDSRLDAGEILPQAIGSNVNGVESIACGEGATANGYLSKALGNYSFTTGLQNMALYASAAVGRGNNSIGEHSLTSGRYNYATGSGSLALGERNRSFGDVSSTIGIGNIAEGKGSFAANGGNQVNGQFSTAFGNNNIVDAPNSIVGGVNNNKVTGKTHLVFGEDLVASNQYQTVFGRFNADNKNAAFIVGNGTGDNERKNAFEVNYGGVAITPNATNDKILNTGDKALITKEYLEAKVQLPETFAKSLQYTLKQGQATSGDALIQGNINGNEASGQHSFASGDRVKARGNQSVAHGIVSESNARGAMAFGLGLVANGYGQTVVGEYNEPIGRANATYHPATPNYDEDTAPFIVGNGTSTERSNAFVVYRDGHAEVQKMGTTGNSVATKEYVDNKSNNKKVFMDIDPKDSGYWDKFNSTWVLNHEEKEDPNDMSMPIINSATCLVDADILNYSMFQVDMQYDGFIHYSSHIFAQNSTDGCLFSDAYNEYTVMNGGSMMYGSNTGFHSIYISYPISDGEPVIVDGKIELTLVHKYGKLNNAYNISWNKSSSMDTPFRIIGLM